MFYWWSSQKLPVYHSYYFLSLFRSNIPHFPAFLKSPALSTVILGQILPIWTNFQNFEEARHNLDKNMTPLSGQKVPFWDQTITWGPASCCLVANDHSSFIIYHPSFTRGQFCHLTPCWASKSWWDIYGKHDLLGFWKIMRIWQFFFSHLSWSESY